jgi:hypothetical protein
MGSFYNRGTRMVERKKGFNKDGTPDKRYGKNKSKPVSHIQDIIDSQQAPGVIIPAQHRADFKGRKVDMEKYKRDTNGKDPHVAVDHSTRTQRGANWGESRPENQPGYRCPDL